MWSGRLITLPNSRTSPPRPPSRLSIGAFYGPDTSHASARTTDAVRGAILQRQGSMSAHAGRSGINPKTVAKWKTRTMPVDAPMGPKATASTVLTLQEEPIIVGLRKHTLLSVDDCLYALQATIPHLTCRCTAVSKGMGSAGCRTSKAISPTARSSKYIRSASCTSTSPK